MDKTDRLGAAAQADGVTDVRPGRCRFRHRLSLKSLKISPAESSPCPKAIEEAEKRNRKTPRHQVT